MCASGTPPPPVLLYTFARRRDGDGLAAPGAAGIPSLRGSRDAEAVLPQDVPEDDDPVLYDSARRVLRLAIGSLSRCSHTSHRLMVLLRTYRSAL